MLTVFCPQNLQPIITCIKIKNDKQWCIHKKSTKVVQKYSEGKK